MQLLQFHLFVQCQISFWPLPSSVAILIGNHMSVAEWPDTYGIQHQRISWSSYRKLAWVGFECTTTEFHSDTLNIYRKSGPINAPIPPIWMYIYKKWVGRKKSSDGCFIKIIKDSTLRETEIKWLIKTLTLLIVWTFLICEKHQKATFQSGYK